MVAVTCNCTDLGMKMTRSRGGMRDIESLLMLDPHILHMRFEIVGVEE